MSVLQEQHSRWAEARARLSPPRVIHRKERVVVPLPQPSEGTEFAPFNFLARPSARAIIKLVGLKHGIDPADILSPSRAKKAVAARDEAMWLVYSHCEKSLPQVGAIFHRDHTTVLHSLRKRSGQQRRPSGGKKIDIASQKRNHTNGDRQLNEAVA